MTKTQSDPARNMKPEKPAKPAKAVSAIKSKVTSEQQQAPAADSRASYHHGNLRDALLAEAIRVIEAQGVENVSIRQLAKNLGVSAAAPFRHFADRTALLTAVAEQATENLSLAVGAALAQAAAQSPWQQLLCIGEAYLGWARAHPSHFLVVSDRRLIDYEASATLRLRNEAIRQRMRQLLVQATGLGAGQGVQPEVCVLMLRAMVYGLARMQADGQLQEWLPPGMTEQAAQNQSLQGLIALLSAYDSGHEQQAF